MDYKSKYLKYKKKYLLKSKQFENKQNQIGLGPSSHEKIIDQRILKNISTGENPMERESREKKQGVHPIDGYRIMESKEEVFRYNYSEEQLKKYGREVFIKQVKDNIDRFFGNLFEIIQKNGSELFYIDARGDGNCFLNSLFIFTILSRNAEKVNYLYSITGIRESNPVNFVNFRTGLYLLANILLDSKKSEFGDEIYEDLKKELDDQNIPSVHFLGQVYCDNFNVRILVIQTDDNFDVGIISAELSPESSNEQTDSVVIIQKGNVHFGLLTPITNDFNLRKLLYNDVKLMYH